MGASAEAALPKDFEGLDLGPAIRPWDPAKFYAKVRKRFAGESRFHSKGLHPVRSNDTCMNLSLELALERLEDEWTRWHFDHSLYVDKNLTYPYFCNNAFLVRRDLYQSIIDHPDLPIMGGADETMLNRVLIENKR